MTDVVVTLPKSFGLDNWVAEGDAAGDPWTGEEWGFYTGGFRPKVEPGDRVYVVCAGKLRGYAPLVRLEFRQSDRKNFGRMAFVRAGGAVAVTIPEGIRGFQGWRYRWWEREIEVPFPDWKTP